MENQEKRKKEFHEIQPPTWASGIIVYEKNVYPLAKSKFHERRYYFSLKWRKLNKNKVDVENFTAKINEKIIKMKCISMGDYISVE